MGSSRGTPSQSADSKGRVPGLTATPRGNMDYVTIRFLTDPASQFLRDKLHDQDPGPHPRGPRRDRIGLLHTYVACAWVMVLRVGVCPCGRL